MHRRKTKWAVALSVALLLFIAGSGWYFNQAFPVFLGFAAKSLCSGVFVSGRPAEEVFQLDIAPVVFFSPLLQRHVDPVGKTATVKLTGLFAKQATYHDGCGCTLLPSPATGRQTVPTASGLARGRLHVPDDVLWPLVTATGLQAAMPVGVDSNSLQAAVSDAFTDAATGRSRRTRAVVVVYRDQLVAERYADGFHRRMPLAGWSMSKSVTKSLVGILVRLGKLRLYAPAPVPEWQDRGDPRQRITLDQLLRMTSGLRFKEVYTPPSDVTEMLFRSRDFGALAASKHLEAPPGEKWHYSSGTTNIIARIIRTIVEPDYGHVVTFVRQELFNRLAMDSAVIELDPSGTIVGSSYTLATARDWARFGLLYLQDGIWKGRRVLPPGWVDYSRTPTPVAPKGQYGAHFWLNAGASGRPGHRRWPALPADMLVAWGFQGQFLIIIPSKELVVVRLGLNTKPQDFDLENFVSRITAALR